MCVRMCLQGCAPLLTPPSPPCCGGLHTLLSSSAVCSVSRGGWDELPPSIRESLVDSARNGCKCFVSRIRCHTYGWHEPVLPWSSAKSCCHMSLDSLVEQLFVCTCVCWYGRGLIVAVNFSNHQSTPELDGGPPDVHKPGRYAHLSAGPCPRLNECCICSRLLRRLYSKSLRRLRSCSDLWGSTTKGPCSDPKGLLLKPVRQHHKGPLRRPQRAPAQTCEAAPHTLLWRGQQPLAGEQLCQQYHCRCDHQGVACTQAVRKIWAEKCCWVLCRPVRQPSQRYLWWRAWSLQTTWPAS